jgi:hypothetical protein
MRARTVRGYKTWPGMQTGLMRAGIKAFAAGRDDSERNHLTQVEINLVVERDRTGGSTVD